MLYTYYSLTYTLCLLFASSYAKKRTCIETAPSSKSVALHFLLVLIIIHTVGTLRKGTTYATTIITVYIMRLRNYCMHTFPMFTIISNNHNIKTHTNFRFVVYA